MHLAASGCEDWFHAHQLARAPALSVKEQWANGGRVLPNGGGVSETPSRSASESPLSKFRLPDQARVVVRVLHATT